MWVVWMLGFSVFYALSLVGGLKVAGVLQRRLDAKKKKLQNKPLLTDKAFELLYNEVNKIYTGEDLKLQDKYRLEFINNSKVLDNYNLSYEQLYGLKGCFHYWGGVRSLGFMEKAPLLLQERILEAQIDD